MESRVRSRLSSKKILLIALGIMVLRSEGITAFAAPVDINGNVTASNTSSNPYRNITYTNTGMGYGAIQPSSGKLDLYLTDDSQVNITAVWPNASGFKLFMNDSMGIDVLSGNLNVNIGRPAVYTDAMYISAYGIFIDRSNNLTINIGNNATTVNTNIKIDNVVNNGQRALSYGVQNAGDAAGVQAVNFYGDVTMDIRSQASNNVIANGIINFTDNNTASVTMRDTDRLIMNLNATLTGTPGAAAYAEAYGLANYGNQSIKIGNNASITSVADSRTGGKSAEAIAAVNLPSLGSPQITIGDNAVVNLKAYGGTDVTRASLAKNLVAGGGTSQGLNISYGQNLQATLYGYTSGNSIYGAAVSVAHNNFGTYDSQISFGTGMTVTATAESAGTGQAYTILAANNSSAVDGNTVIFGDNIYYKGTSSASSTGSALALGLNNQGSDNQIAMGDGARVILEANSQGGLVAEAVGASNTASTNYATITIGNNSSWDLTVTGGASIASLLGLENFGDNVATNMQQSITVGDNTVITGKVTTAATVGEALGVINRHNSFNSDIVLGNNTTINMDITNSGGSVLTAGLSSDSNDNGNNTITAGNNTTIILKGQATGTSGTEAIGVRNIGSADRIDIGDNTVINVQAQASSGLVQAIGVENANIGGNLVLRGGADINVQATSALGSASYAYALYSTTATDSDSRIWLNIDPNTGSSYGGNVKLVGDVIAAGAGNIHLSLPTAASTLRGTVLQNNNGYVSLSMDNGAKWLLTNNSYDAAGNAVVTLADNSIRVYNLQVGTGVLIDLTSDARNRLDNWRTLSYNAAYDNTIAGSAFDITGSGNTFVLNSDIATNQADKIVISSSVAGINYIKINNDTTYANGGIENKDTKTLVVETVGDVDNFAGTFIGARTDVGLRAWTPNVEWDAADNNWYIVGHENSYSKVVNANIAYMRLPNTTFLKRMGELRENKDEHGLWLRIYGGESSLYSGAGNQTHKAIQGGIDNVEYKEDRTVFKGFMLESVTASSSWNDGSRGRSSLFDIGLYQSNLYNNGRYYDLVAKFYNINHHISTIDSSMNTVNGKYRNWALEGSIEYGRRKELGKGYYWIPQAQLTYRHIKGANYTTDNAVTFKQSDINSLVGRLGVVIGRKYKDKGQLYLDASVLREFLAKTSVNISDNYGQHAHIGISDKETWYSLALGYTKKTSEKTDIYMEIERTFGSRNNLKWQGKIGARWSW